jgi:predicted DNA-binding transcriptional regulator AlpA
MAEYQFTLKFALADPAGDPEAYLDALFEAGCDDALVGIGQHGSIGLDFSREARSAAAAVHSAIRDVEQAIPDAELIEAAPDMVGLAEIAELLGCSRQNVRKLVSSSKAAFPQPVHTGGHASLWHMVDVLVWANTRNKRLAVADPRRLYEVAAASVSTNVSIQFARYGKSAQVAAEAAPTD